MVTFGVGLSPEPVCTIHGHYPDYLVVGPAGRGGKTGWWRQSTAVNLSEDRSVSDRVVMIGVLLAIPASLRPSHLGTVRLRPRCVLRLTDPPAPELSWLQRMSPMAKELWRGATAADPRAEAESLANEMARRASELNERRAAEAGRLQGLMDADGDGDPPRGPRPELGPAHRQPCARPPAPQV